MKIYDPYTRFHNKIDLAKIVPKLNPLFEMEKKEGAQRLSSAHVRKQNFKTLNLFTKQFNTREAPLPPEFKSVLELSCRAPYCPIPFTLDTMMGVCSYSCIYCVPGNTYILRANKKGQPKKISKMKIGEKVFGYDSKNKTLSVNTVLSVMKRLSKEGYLEIKTKKGYILKVTAEHPIYTKNGWKKASSLKEGGKILALDNAYTKGYSKLSENMKKNNPMKDKKIPFEQKKKIGEVAKLSVQKRWKEDEAYQDIVKHTMKTNNPMWRPEVASRMGETRSDRIRTGKIDITKAQTLSGLRKYPSKNEKIFIQFLKKEGFPFKFVGNSKLWVGRRNPDFVDTINGKHLIELYTTTQQFNEEKERPKYYKTFGYNTLMVHMDELKKVERLRKRILKFLGNPSLFWDKIIEIKTVQKPTIVFNLETDGTNTYFANGIGVHNCFTALTVSSLMSSFFDSDNPLVPRYANPQHTKEYLDEVLTARGVEPYERSGKSDSCGTISDPHSLKKAAAQRVPLRFGTRSENFLPREKEVGVALGALKMIKEHNYPLIINTKSDLITEGEYFKIITEMDKNVAIQVSITHNDDLIAKKLEPGAPSSTRRWEVLKTFNDVGINAMVRMEPAMAFINNSDEHLEAFFTSAEKSGCKNFMGDPYHHTVRAEEIKRLFYREGFDFDRMWEGSSEYQILGSYVFEKAMYYAKKHGLRAGTFNFHSLPWNDSAVCCMVGEQFKTWSKYSLLHLLRNEVIEKGRPIGFKELDEKYYGYELHPGLRKRIKDVWNEKLISAWNPSWVEGMVPVGLDEDENIIWNFDPDRMGEWYRRIVKIQGGN